MKSSSSLPASLLLAVFLFLLLLLLMRTPPPTAEAKKKVFLGSKVLKYNAKKKSVVKSPYKAAGKKGKASKSKVKKGKGMPKRKPTTEVGWQGKRGGGATEKQLFAGGPSTIKGAIQAKMLGTAAGVTGIGGKQGLTSPATKKKKGEKKKAAKKWRILTMKEYQKSMDNCFCGGLLLLYYYEHNKVAFMSFYCRYPRRGRLPDHGRRLQEEGVCSPAHRQAKPGPLAVHRGKADHFHSKVFCCTLLLYVLEF